jgi:hypothetical protein
MIAFFEKLEPTVVGIEACGAAHHWVPDHACRSFFFPGRFAPRLLGGMLSGMSGGGRNCFKVHSPAALVMMLRPTRPRSSLLLDVLKDA